MIGKYPPIEGGVSTRTYWLARALGEQGVEVHIVTNAQEVEEEYKEIIQDGDPEYAPPNVYVHSTNEKSHPWYIPFSKSYAERIASLAIEVIKKYDLQLIDSYYILPYVISGFLAKTITDIPQIMRHAGSDMGRLLSSPNFSTLFGAIFKKVDRIITYPDDKEEFVKRGIPESRISITDRINVNLKAFNSEVIPLDLSTYLEKNIGNIPVISFIGKIPYLWESKGIGELLEAIEGIKEDFLLLFFSGGKGLPKVRQIVRDKGLERQVVFLKFVPPWKVPSIMKRSTCVVVPEHDFPIANHTPSIPAEVLAVGKCLILSNELYEKKPYQELVNGENVLIIDPKNIIQFRSIIERIIKCPDEAEKIGQEARKLSERIENFNEYVSHTIKLYEQI